MALLYGTGLRSSTLSPAEYVLSDAKVEWVALGTAVAAEADPPMDQGPPALRDWTVGGRAGWRWSTVEGWTREP